MTRHPQTNGICERFHKTMLNEFYRVAFRKEIYRTLEEMQTDLDARMEDYNKQRSHQGCLCYGRTPMHTFMDNLSSRRLAQNTEGEVTEIAVHPGINDAAL
jgi:hypothetical protein